jgi:hypothetical protein
MRFEKLAVPHLKLIGRRETISKTLTVIRWQFFADLSLMSVKAL